MDLPSVVGQHNLVDLLASSASRHASNTALELGGTSLTYEQLWEQADEIAVQVLGSCQRPARVGLDASRSVGAYSGYIAAFRVGAAVVPISPSAPLDRVLDIVRRGALDIVMCDDGVSAATIKAITEAGVPCLVLGSAGENVDTPRSSVASVEAARPAITGDDDAYIMFTSGSTGTPKGVPVTHGSLMTYLAHVIERYKIGPGTRVSQNFELTFDLSVFDIFAAFLSGATLVVPTRGELLLPVKYAKERQLTHWFSVPSLITHAIRTRKLAPDAMPDLRWSLFCGEALSQEQAEAWAGAAPASVVENLYGPTELTITCAEYRLLEDRADWPVTANGTVPIGHIMPGHDWIVLGPDLERAPSGELCVRGPQRLRGYLDPRDNDGRFVSWVPGAKAKAYNVGEALTPAHWYRTGDRVELLDGVLVHCGRLDRQVKLRGYRIELGEIEHVIRSAPGVESAAVVVLPSTDGGRLVCVFSGDESATGQLAGIVAARLPAYMHPAMFIHREALPLNNNGKTDYSAIRNLALLDSTT
jgi:amino acid adenylation domain-containing protein